MTTYVSVALASEKQHLQKPQCMFYDAVFSNANLKQSKLQELFEDRHGEANVVGHESLRAKRASLDSRAATLPKLGFVLTNHRGWLHAKWRLK